tara:strand:+ start:515 stop:787 length:273 start_codon:yes stop_codon:yes gene_type:complete
MNEQEARKKFGIPPNANLQLIDMDANPDKFEVITGGWTDDQIRNKKMEDIDALIEQSINVQNILQKNLDEQRERTMSYKKIRDRKLTLKT